MIRPYTDENMRIVCKEHTLFDWHWPSIQSKVYKNRSYTSTAPTINYTYMKYNNIIIKITKQKRLPTMSNCSDGRWLKK